MLITAQWGNGIEEFRADMHHLTLNDCKETEYDTLEFDFDEAYNSVKYKNRFHALGKSGLGTSYLDMTIKISKHSNAYFAENQDYNYLLNNCGDYVREIVDLTKPEFGAIEVPLAPPMIKRTPGGGGRGGGGGLEKKTKKKKNNKKQKSAGVKSPKPKVDPDKKSDTKGRTCTPRFPPGAKNSKKKAGSDPSKSNPKDKNKQKLGTKKSKPKPKSKKNKNNKNNKKGSRSFRT